MAVFENETKSKFVVDAVASVALAMFYSIIGARFLFLNKHPQKHFIKTPCFRVLVRNCISADVRQNCGSLVSFSWPSDPASRPRSALEGGSD